MVLAAREHQALVKETPTERAEECLRSEEEKTSADGLAPCRDSIQCYS